VDATAIEAALLAKKYTFLHLQFSEPKTQLTATKKTRFNSNVEVDVKTAPAGS
jgi:hypothetical protein